MGPHNNTVSGQLRFNGPGQQYCSWPGNWTWTQTIILYLGTSAEMCPMKENHNFSTLCFVSIPQHLPTNMIDPCPKSIFECLDDLKIFFDIVSDLRHVDTLDVGGFLFVTQCYSCSPGQ